MFAGYRGQKMQTKNLKRGERRDFRQRAVDKAYQRALEWSWFDDTYQANYINLYTRERLYLESNQERWEFCNEVRQANLQRAKRIADNLCVCSCFLCAGHKKYTKTKKQMQELEKDNYDILSLDEFGGGSSFNAIYGF